MKVRLTVTAPAILILPQLTAAAEQSALSPAGPQAQHINVLWWIFFWVCVAVWLITVIMMIVSMLGSRKRAAQPVCISSLEPPIAEPPPAQERRFTIVVASLVGLTTFILLALLI